MKKPVKKTLKEKLTGKVNAVDMLTDDHDEVKKLFKQFKQLVDDDAPHAEKSAIVKKACNVLLIHMKLEEELFYPAVRKAIRNDELMDEAKVEHDGVKQFIDQLLDMMPGEEMYDAKFIVLSEQMSFHIKEEEGKMFPAAKKAKIDLDRLAVQMQKRKDELEQEMGVAEVGEEDIAMMSARERARMTDEGLIP